MTSTERNISNTIALLTSLISGLTKNQPKGTFVIAGVTYSTAQIVKIIQMILAALAAVGPAKGAYLKATSSAGTLQKQNRPVLLGLKQILQIQAAGDTAILADYGLTPRKSPGTKSPKVKAAAAVKAKATRVLRHTVGPKVRKGITAASVAAASSAPAAQTTVATGPGAVNATPVTTAGH